MYIFLGIVCGLTASRAYLEFKYYNNMMGGLVLGIISLLCGFFAGIFI